MIKVLALLSLSLIVFSSCITKSLRESSTGKSFSSNNLSSENIYNKIVWGNNKSVLFIPAIIDNYKDTVYFQLDLGTGYTELNEKGISILMQDSSIKQKIAISNGRYYYMSPEISINNHDVLHSQKLPINNYYPQEGYKISNDSLAKLYKNDGLLVIGTLGYDFIYGKILILDFRNDKYCLTEKVQDSLLLSDESLVKASVYAWPPIIKAKYRGRNKRLIYDTGSSRVGLSLFCNEWRKSDGYDIDTLKGWFSWGVEKFTVQKITTEKLVINDVNYTNFPILSSEVMEENKLGFRLLNTSAIIGNYLFFNSTLIIDVKNNKMWINN